ncbi:hypothetical protein ES711_01825 [Gelidibacter salicanalis]|uniref:Uncharacterized protein n=1 Tax=Gelidibacter salicanalis TaxID=291193 RepID=A0A5C7AQQ2_9FLAO|nr:hypothetical protein [Gelidibacter salicanalis]TXE10671.1 hypothetical protein ES711_01825 [Gelidibacter salicanalis]
MKKSELHNITDPGFKIPDSYFDTFDERLFKTLDVQKDMSEIDGPGYKVPKDYFKNFDTQLAQKLEDIKQPKVKSIKSWRQIAYYSGVAAVLVVMLTVFMKSEDDLSINQVETASIESYLTNENLNIYDIASFLSAEDIKVEDFVANMITDESLETYLLNNASIEDLINEK